MFDSKLTDNNGNMTDSSVCTSCSFSCTGSCIFVCAATCSETIGY